MVTILTYANLNQLFMGPPLRDALRQAHEHALRRLREWDPDALLHAAESDVVAELLGSAMFEVPDVHRDLAELAEGPREITQEAFSNRGASKRIVTRYTLIVPIVGPPEFFQKTPSRFTPSPVHADIDRDQSALLLHCDDITDPVQIRSYFDRRLDVIQQLLPQTQAEVEAHNTAMRAEIPHQVAARRAKLLNDRDIQAHIGFPIKRRNAADTYSVALTRRAIHPDRTSSSDHANPYIPEPTLAFADYEAALAVLHRARAALERSPSMTSKLNEEELRDLLLVMLNDHFDGKAGGEVFNCAGKTDILIREGNKNIFIAECKIHSPRRKKKVETVVIEALAQLLRYLTWRDTKAALLLFVRDADLTTVMNKAVAAIKSYSNYKRDGRDASEERYDAILHANGDSNREIHLAFLAFHVTSTNQPQ